jgi:hypothetical protein
MFKVSSLDFPVMALAIAKLRLRLLTRYENKAVSSAFSCNPSLLCKSLTGCEMICLFRIEIEKLKSDLSFVI